MPFRHSLLIGAALTVVTAYQSSQLPRTRQASRLKTRVWQSAEGPRPCRKSPHPCDEESSPSSSSLWNDDELDRREAGFALLGQLWAAGALPTALLFPDAAHAGAEAKIELPNPVNGLYDRSTKECLVESLGNRECLVYADDAANFLYQGTENKLLLERIEKASRSLATIPELAQAKKWSQVTGVMAGPCGELIRTLGQLAEKSDNTAAAKKRVQKLKTDLYALQAGVDRKQGDVVLQYHKAVTQDLVDFVKAM